MTRPPLAAVCAFAIICGLSWTVRSEPTSGLAVVPANASHNLELGVRQGHGRANLARTINFLRPDGEPAGLLPPQKEKPVLPGQAPGMYPNATGEPCTQTGVVDVNLAPKDPSAPADTKKMLEKAKILQLPVEYWMVLIIACAWGMNVIYCIATGDEEVVVEEDEENDMALPLTPRSRTAPAAAPQQGGFNRLTSGALAYLLPRSFAASSQADPRDETRSNIRRTRTTITTVSHSAEQGHGSHKLPWRQYFFLAFWLLLLVMQSGCTRIYCKFGIPRDCDVNMDLMEWAIATHLLLAYGFVVAVFTGLTHESRFLYLFRFSGSVLPRGWAFILLFLASSPFYGCLDLVPALSQFSIHSGTSWGIVNIALLCFVAGGFSFLGLWHVWHAYKNCPPEGVAAYVSTRFVILLLHAAYFMAAEELSTVNFHLHHYAVGFLFAILAEFNHPISLVLLACASGVMVQGIAAYGADPTLSRDGSVHL